MENLDQVIQFLSKSANEIPTVLSTVGPAQASVSAVHSTVPAPPSHTATHAEDATQFDLNLEFAVSKLNEASVDEPAIAIKVASQGDPLSTCGDDDTEHALLAAIGR